MANLCLAATRKLREMLTAEDGLAARVEALAARDGARPPRIGPANVAERHAGSTLADENIVTLYPLVYVYCERMENRLERKFSAFSGRLFAVAEARVSGESIQALDGELERMVEAIGDLLAESRGQWTENLAFDGRFDVEFAAVRKGAAHFLREARVRIELLACA